MTTITKLENTQTKEERFLKLASRRQRKVLEGLDLIANLSVTSRHSYDREQAEDLIKSLEERAGRRFNQIT